MPIAPRVRASCLSLAACALLLHAACRTPSLTDYYELKAPLVAVDGGTASGRYEAWFSAVMRHAYAEVTGLAPEAVYVLAYDGAAVASFETDAAGAGYVGHAVSLRTHDPRGRRVSVRDAAGADVLVLAGASHPAYVESDHVPLASFGPGQGYAHLRSSGGVTTLRVSLGEVPPGRYELVVNGVARGTIDAPKGFGHVTVDATGLDRDAGSIEVQQDGVGLYASGLYASVFGIDWCAGQLARQTLIPHASGSAVASLRTQADCGRRLTVELRDVPVGDYVLWVAGAPRGTIYVGEDENGATGGSIEFATGERTGTALRFDPVGQPIEVVSSDGLAFSVAAFEP